MSRRSPALRPLIGTKLREKRLSLGMRQSDIARQTGISAAYLNLIEHNRRPVGNDLLARLAEALETVPQDLSSNREEVLIASIREAAARADWHADLAAEIDHIAEFVARFPGWASTLASALRRTEALEERLVSLSDRMTRDPYLLTTLHEVQSAVTALRSTASILAETPEIEAAWRDRFHANLDHDSQRLSRTAQSLVAYLDSFEDDAVPMSPREEVEAWTLSGAKDSADCDMLASDVAKTLATEILAEQAQDRLQLPDDLLAQAVQAQSDQGDGATLRNPLSLAQMLGCPLDLVLRRLAVLRPGPWRDSGLIICDGSGAPLYRQPAQGFVLPRPGEGCALWPLYEALSQPQLPIARLLETPSGMRFQAWAISNRHMPLGFDGPALSRAQMLLLPAPPDDGRAALPVGPSCRICPRPTCAARHEPSILGPV